MNGTFEEFLDALLAFESGWDRERFDSGIIQSWQLDQWSGGTVDQFFPQYSSWSQLSDSEWETMAYRSMNSLGFVGFQFGEALLIDLGYYDDDFYYGNGAATNTWDGSWTGKNGISSLEEFMTKEAQDVAIREAFGHNLSIINNGLSAAGRSLDEFIGSTISYTSGGSTVPVTISMTGLLAAAHLRGAYGLTDLLLNGSVTTDENGTSILQYIEQFGGYESPSSDELVAYFEGRVTGDEGVGAPGDSSSGGTDGGSSSGGTSNGDADVDSGSADVVISWSWGANTVEHDFDPATDTVFIDWFKADEISISEVAGNVVFSIPSNNQAVTLQGVSLSDLSPENFTILDTGTASGIFAAIGQGAGGQTDADNDDGAGEAGGGNTGGDTGADTGGDSGSDTGGDTDDNAGGGDTGGGSSGGNTGGGSTGGGTDAGSSANTPIIAAYFPEWGTYGRDHNIVDVQADNITNLIYSFVNVNTDFEIQLHDDWAANGIAFDADNSVDGVADTWDQDQRGHFNQLAELKEANPHLTTQLGIGGWTLSGNFSDMAATAKGRATFINSVIEFLEEYTMFDGIDFDWEYPGGGGLAGNSARPEDGANFTLLAAEMREALDQLGSETGREYTMSAALPGGYDKIANLDIPGLAESLDFMNIMTYDYYGAWDNTTGHLAGMYDVSGGNYDITTAIELYLDAGVDPSQIVLGLPAYTRAWQGVSVDNPIDAWNNEGSGGAPGSFEAGSYDYKDLLEQLQAQDSDWGLYYDDDAQAAFLYSPTTGIFSSFETPATIALKSEWAQSLGLGGVMFWDTSSDSNGPESLITAAYNSWFEGMTFDEIDAASALEFDAVFGGDGVVAPIAESDTPPTDLPDGPDEGDDQGDGGQDDGDQTDGDTGDNSGNDDGAGGNDDNSGGDTGNASGSYGNGTANVTAATATVVVNWAWGSNTVAQDFDPQSDTIYISWFGADVIEVSDTSDGVVISIPSNNQSVTLQGVSLDDLSASNFTIMDDGAAAEILAAVSGATGGANDSPTDGDGSNPPAGGGDNDDTDDNDDPDTNPDDSGDGIQNVVDVQWSWAAEEVISNFALSEDVIDFGAMDASRIDITEVDDDLHIEILGNGGQKYILENVQAEDLSMANLTAPDWNEDVIDRAAEQLAVLGNDDFL